MNTQGARTTERDAEAAPLLVRIAGLPAEIMESFHSELCTMHIDPLRALRAELKAARATLVETIYPVVSQASPTLRRVLLEVKRSCFNGRRLARYRDTPPWQALCALVGPSANRVLDLEDAWEGAHSAFLDAYRAVAARERTALTAIATDQRLLRGIALSSTVLIDNLPRLGRGQNPRKEAQLGASLLRYVSRTAFKTSPFSTLTGVGLGLIVSESEAGALTLQGSPWVEHSLLRYKRYVLEQDCAMLLRYPPLREQLVVEVNSSLHEILPGHYAFLCPGFWGIQEAEAERDASALNAKKMNYTHPSLADVKLGGPVLAWLLEHLPREEIPYAALRARLARQFTGGVEAQVEATLSKLLTLGMLRLRPPWPTNDAHRERSLLEQLCTLPPSDELDAARGVLERLVALEEGYAHSREPHRTLMEIEAQVDSLWLHTRRLGGAGPEAERFRFPASALYEDLFLHASPQSSPWQEVVRISRQTVDTIVESLMPLVHLAQLFHPRQEFLHTLTAFAGERWPGRKSVEVIELLREVQPLWRSYIKFVREWRSAGAGSQPTLSFNPLGLAAVRQLQAMREDVWRTVEDCTLEAGEEECVLDGARLAAALARLPARYRETQEACALVQPADSRGERWVLNRLYEGTGRYASRYTPVMPEHLRERYTAWFAECAVRDRNGQRTEFLDLMFNFGDTLNVHAVQTPKVLELPDEWIDVAPERKLRLRDLLMRPGDEDEPPRLIDHSGNELVPVHLGGVDLSFVPVVVRLLSMLGPGELAPLNLPRRPRRCGDLEVWRRLRIGSVVVGRRGWFVPRRLLPPEIFEDSPAERFIKLNEWRLELGIPEQVFMVESLRDDRGTFYKPQYLDFTAPAFVELALTAFEKMTDLTLRFDEMLPLPTMLPAAADGTRRAIELQLDTLSLRRAAR
jgi:hypothetical protein